MMTHLKTTIKNQLITRVLQEEEAEVVDVKKIKMVLRSVLRNLLLELQKEVENQRLHVMMMILRARS
jgi:hypothetical protein